MHGETLPPGKASPRYRCGGDDRTSCHQTANRDAVERAVLDQIGAVIEALVTDQRVREGLRRAWNARQQASSPDNTSRIRALEGRIEKSRQRITRGTELLVDGSIDKGAYDELVAKARRDADAAEIELAELNASKPTAPKLPPIDQVLTAAGSWAAVLAGADVRAQRDVLALLIGRIVPVRESRGVYSAALTWTPLGVGLQVVMQA